MIKLWSELPAARTRPIAGRRDAPVGGLLGQHRRQLFQFLSSFAEAGRTVHGGGVTMIQGGRDLGGWPVGLPIVGSQARDAAQKAYSPGAGAPLSDFGTEMEQFIFVVAIVLALLLALVTLALAHRYRHLPWRWGRVRSVRAAHRAIRTMPGMADALRRARPGDAGRQPARLRDPPRVHAGSARRLDERPPSTGWPGQSSPARGYGPRRVWLRSVPPAATASLRERTWRQPPSMLRTRRGASGTTRCGRSSRCASGTRPGACTRR